MEISPRQFQRPSLALVLMLGWALAGTAVATQLTISGTVADSEGRPLAGTKVRLTPVMDDYRAYDLWLGHGMWAEPVAMAKTAEDGRYALQAAPGQRWRLVVEHPGRATVTRRLEPFFEDREMSVVELRPAHPLEVRIKTASGRAVAGARVMAYSRSASGGPWPFSWVAGASDELGQARLNVPPVGPWRIEVAAEGLVPVRVEHAGDAVAEVELVAGTRLALRLRLPAGEPASSAVVYRPQQGLTLAMADTQGRVALLGAPGSRQRIRGLTADYASLEAVVEFPARGQPQGHRTLDLMPPIELAVHAVAAGSLDPVAAAVARGRDDHAAFGDDQGRLTLTIPVTQTSISLSLAAPRHLPWTQHRVPVSLAGQQTMTVGLEPSVELRGRVTGSDGRPLADVAVEVRAEMVPNALRHYLPRTEGRNGRSGADGRFVISPLPAETRLGLVARKVGFTTTYVDIEGLRPGQIRSEFELSLTAGRRIVGKVLDTSMRPVVGASVEALSWRRGANRSRPELYRTAYATEASAVTDAAGQFELRDLGTAPFDLWISAAEFVATRVPDITIGGGVGTVDLGTFSLRQGLVIAGQVVDEADLPVSGAEVFLGKPGEQPVSWSSEPSLSISDSEGRFAFADRAAGFYQVRARQNGFLVAESGRLSVPVAAPLVLVMRRGATLAGRIVDGEGNAVAGGWVSSVERASAARSVSDTTDETGLFELAGLAFAEHGLTFTAAGFQPQRRRIQVLPGAKVEPLEVVLKRGAIVAGQVKWPDGRPIPEVLLQVTALAEGGSNAPSGRSNVSGQFEIDNVPIGPALIVARIGTAERSQEIDVGLGANLVSLTLPLGVEVSGRVRDVDGEPVPWARLTLRPAMGGRIYPQAVSGDDGRFTFVDIAPGPYRLKVRHPRYAAYSAKSKFEVRSEPVTGLEARLRRGALVSGRLEGLDLESLPAVRVALLGRSGSHSAALDFEGRFRFEQVLPGEYRAEARLGKRVVAASELELPAGKDKLEIELIPREGVEFRGRVVRGAQPVGNALVKVHGRDGRLASTYTSADGIFVLQGISEGPQKLTTEVFSGHRHQRRIEVRKGREVIVELPTAEVSGRVRDAASGELLAGVEVDLLALEEALDAPTKDWQSRSHHGAISDSTGVFALRGVDRGRYRLSVQHEGYGWLMTEVEVGSTPLRDIDLDLNPPKGLVLRVALDDGEPMKWVRVALLDQAGRRMLETNQRVGADGKAHLVAVPNGAWQLWVKSGNSAWTWLDVRVPGSEDVPVKLTAGAGVTFAVPESAGEVGDLRVRLRDADGRTLPGMGREGDTFTSLDQTGFVSHLWPGRWTLELLHPDGRTWRATFTARAGETSELELH